MLLQIKGPYFTAGMDLTTGEIAPILKYMKGWSVYKIIDYCAKKGWDVYMIDHKGIYGSP